MALSATLNLKQSQSLVMTPQLMQSIKLLQLSNLELQNYVTEELQKNPLLEAASSDDNARVRGEGSQDIVESHDNSSVGEAATLDLKDQANFSEALGNSALENVYDGGKTSADGPGAGTTSQSQSSLSGTSREPSSSAAKHENAYNIEAFIADNVSLHDHLMEQANIHLKTTSDRRTAEEIVGSIDEDGYLRRNLADIAMAVDVDLEDAEAVLGVIHTFDPSGIGARDIRESLSIQLRQKDRFDPMMEQLINHLDLLAKRDFDGLKKLCNATGEDLQDMVEEIRSLNPRPASHFDAPQVQEVIPDVFVLAKADGSWAVDVNNAALPKVLINQTYYSEVSASVQKEEDKTFISNCLTDANWLVRSLDQRAQTILKVTTEIVKQQDMFFAYGVEHLRPLNLKTVADNIKMHESTVSRVTSNKYIMCDRGLFEMKYFFTAAIAASDGVGEHSAEAVRYKIKQLIDQESPKKILSDDALAQALIDQGVDIARRTVAKYREAMGIASSVERRREKRNIIAA